MTPSSSNFTVPDQDEFVQPRYYVALVIERSGESPGRNYAQYVQKRAVEIRGQLDFVKHMTARLMSDIGRRRPATGGTIRPAQDDGSSGSQQLMHLPLLSTTTTTAQDANDGDNDEDEPAAPPTGPKRPLDKPQQSGAANKRQAQQQPQSKQTEKTHLFVCTQPFALLDELNASNERRKHPAGQPVMHYYMAAVAGEFEYRWSAERYCTQWGGSSRGAGPRAGWGDALKTVHCVGMYVDVGIVFDQNFPLLELESTEPNPDPNLEPDSESGGGE